MQVGIYKTVQQIAYRQADITQLGSHHTSRKRSYRKTDIIEVVRLSCR
jgi:hypothetical protein